MLTLKQLLESDSLATIVAKLNQNFQVLSNSNGGPQGIRGPQGIPGLPGKMGPMGSTGSAGPTGTIIGVLPFSPSINTVGVGPSVITMTNYGKVGPWPSSSYDWLLNYYGANIGGNGVTPAAGEIFIDHGNGGYWKYLTAPDIDGAAFTGNITGNPYQYAADPIYVYPNLGPGSTPIPGGFLGLYAGEGWYFYPGQDASAVGGGQVWTEDYTTYLQSALQGGSGPFKVGPYDGSTTNPLTIPNARLVTKYGTVWITSGNDATDAQSDGDLKTSNIGKWGLGPGKVEAQPGRYNAGIDRLLFKMSLDGLSYQSNITARGYTGPATMTSPALTSGEFIANTDYPVTQNGTKFPSNPIDYWVKPQYEVTLDKYSPLLFLTHRTDGLPTSQGTFGSLGIFIYTDTQTEATSTVPQPNNPYGNGTLNDNNVSKSIHLFSSRYAPDPMAMWDGVPSLIDSASTLNFGEMVLDFRRIIASNQYVCSLPTDMKLSSDYRTSASGTYDESALDGSGNPLNANRYKTFQGYISSINGKSLTGDAASPYYLEYGLGSASPNGSAGIHDLSSGTAGMLTRRTWYGTSVLNVKNFNNTNPGDNDYVRVAGMLERGRRFRTSAASGGGAGTDRSYFLSELIFYTSQFAIAGVTAGQQIDIDDVVIANNQHNSLPSLYVSPFRNIGIGTFVGLTGGLDGGPLEPMAKLHVHVKPMDRANDPTYDYKVLPTGASPYLSFLPTKVYAAAAFSGQLNDEDDKSAVTDILLGNVFATTSEQISPNGNIVNQLSSTRAFKNAIRTESWKVTDVSTMHLGASPIDNASSIGRNSVDSYKKEFQISLAPLNPTVASLTSNPLRANTGVGIHNMFPRARFHMFGKNLYNETEWGLQPWTPSPVANMSGFAGLSGSYPFYGVTGTNAPSANQVVIDYIGSSYNYPVGVYEYQYWTFPGNTGTVGTSSPNSAVYPNREQLGITRWINSYTTAESANFAFPVTTANTAVNYLGSYKHGGTANAFWDPQTYIGFNLFRDLSSASNLNTKGDDRDDARWMLGTQGATANGHGNNGGAAIISSSQGELGIITIPRGRDGGRAYEQWEQRGLGTRDVLNQMKIVFDKNGNIAIGNAAGWDLDAYPSLNWNMTNGFVNYLPTTNATTSGPLNANQFGAATTLKYGAVSYVGYNETSTASPASLINSRATSPEYIRLEVGAEKAWSRDGRMLQKLGWGYPPNSTIVITGSTLNRYIIANFTGLVYNPSITSWTLQTDNEGRIVNNYLTVSFGVGISRPSYVNTPITSANISVVVFPHPSEFNTGNALNTLIGTNFTAPAGAIAAEWWGMNNDYTTVSKDTILVLIAGNFLTSATIQCTPTTDLRGSANVRLNNFVYGEGFGISGGTQGGGNTYLWDEGNYTKQLVQQKRQESPKLILSFLEKTPTVSRPTSGLTPYMKVNTVIASAQNEVSLREYWIPKAANTGGTFMVFTDFLGQKEKDVRFNDTPIKNKGLFLEEVVTQEFLAGYRLDPDGQPNPPRITEGTSNWCSTSTYTPDRPLLDYDIKLKDNLVYFYPSITPINMYPGYVRYYNKAYNIPNAPAHFSTTEYGEIDVVSSGVSSTYASAVQVQAEPPKHFSTFRAYSTQYDSDLRPDDNSCNTAIYDGPITMRFGSTTNGIRIENQYATMTKCPNYAWKNVDDSFYEPGTTVNTNDAAGSIADKRQRSQANSNNWAYCIFSRKTLNEMRNRGMSVPITPAGVKITIRLKMSNVARGAYPVLKNYGELGLRFYYDVPTGNGISTFRAGLKSNSMGSIQDPTGSATVASETNKLIAKFEIQQTRVNPSPVETFGTISVDGEDSIYMSWAQWETRGFWTLGAAYRTIEGGNEVDDWELNPFTSTEDEGLWEVHEFEIKFELVWPQDGFGMANSQNVVNTNDFNASSIRRNIDKYYEIYKPTDPAQPQWGDIDEQDNQKTQIRLKRINSEYALLDYNITVKVNNPDINRTSTIRRVGDPASYVDFCSPRFTQYLRFVYTPDDPGSAGNSKLLYGEDLSLINWSSYKNWLPGAAIVGDDISLDGSQNAAVATNTTYEAAIGENLRTMTNDWSPFYNDYPNFSGLGDISSVITWNGNILEMVAYASYAYGGTTTRYFTEQNVGRGNSRYSILTSPLRSFYSSSGYTSNTTSDSGQTGNDIYAAFGSDFRILSHAYKLFPYTRTNSGIDMAQRTTVNVEDADAAKQMAFVGYLGAMYAMWGNKSFMRNKNTQWRILPATPYQAGDATLNTGKNRSFYLEVQLSDPILHVDTPLGVEFYASAPDAAVPCVKPYRFLTLSGQAIVKYAETNVINPTSEIPNTSRIF